MSDALGLVGVEDGCDTVIGLTCMREGHCRRGWLQ